VIFGVLLNDAAASRPSNLLENVLTGVFFSEAVIKLNGFGSRRLSSP
jgi:hypothetical protein